MISAFCVEKSFLLCTRIGDIIVSYISVLVIYCPAYIRKRIIRETRKHQKVYGHIVRQILGRGRHIGHRPCISLDAADKNNTLVCRQSFLEIPECLCVSIVVRVGGLFIAFRVDEDMLAVY